MSTTKTFSQQLDAQRTGPDSFTMTIEPGWAQGRGAFGGLLVGTLVRAAVTAVGDASRKVRSVTAEILGPVLVGEATLHLDRLRQGAGVSAVRVRLVQAGDELCQAVVVMGKDRPNPPTWSRLPPPQMPLWSSIEVAPDMVPIAPEFTPHFDFRVTGAAPGSSSPEALTSGFVQARRPERVVDAAFVAGLADVWWPAAMVCFDTWRPMATITYALEICCDLAAVDGRLPLFHTARADLADAGYTVEHRQLWTPEGRLVAQNQQVFAVIR